MKKTYLVIYYDGDNTRMAFIEGENPESAVPRMWGLPDHYDINVVIDVKEQHVKSVWIDELQVLDNY